MAASFSIGADALAVLVASLDALGADQGAMTVLADDATHVKPEREFVAALHRAARLHHPDRAATFRRELRRLDLYLGEGCRVEVKVSAPTNVLNASLSGVEVMTGDLAKLRAGKADFLLFVVPVLLDQPHRHYGAVFADRDGLADALDHSVDTWCWPRGLVVAHRCVLHGDGSPLGAGRVDFHVYVLGLDPGVERVFGPGVLTMEDLDGGRHDKRIDAAVIRRNSDDGVRQFHVVAPFDVARTIGTVICDDDECFVFAHPQGPVFEYRIEPGISMERSPG